MNCPVFIINLVRSPDRRQHMEAELQRVGITDYTFVNAIDGNDLKPEVIAAHQEKIIQHYNLPLLKDHNYRIYRDLYALATKMQKDLNIRTNLFYKVNKYELACSLSHLKCYQLFLARGAEAALILEDDAVLSTDLPKVIDHIDQFSPNWQVAYASEVPFRVETNVHTRKKVYKGYTMGQACGPISGTVAYFISREGANYWLHTRNLLGGDYPSIEAFCADLPNKKDPLAMLLLMHYPVDEWLWRDIFNRYLYNYHIIKPRLVTWANITQFQSTFQTNMKENPASITQSFWDKWLILRTWRYMYRMLLGRGSFRGFLVRFNLWMAVIAPYTAPNKRKW